MRIFHLLSNPGIGGIEGMLGMLIRRVGCRDCDMRIINMRSESEAYGLWEQLGVPYMRLLTPSGVYVSSIKTLYHILHRERPDIVEIHGLRANLIGRIAARLARIPVIITGVVSTDDWRRRHHVALDRLTSPWVTGWIANSNSCKQSLIRREGFSGERISVIYDGIDIRQWTLDASLRERRIEYRRSFGYHGGDVVCVTVANLREEKGVQYLVEAAPNVLAECPGVRFLIVGSDWMNGLLQKRCKLLGVAHAFTFAGFRRDIRNLYAAGDVAVLPSLQEGLPICLIEAMSMCLPVIGTCVSGIPELVDAPRTGILVAPGNPRELSAAIIALGKTPQARGTMGELGRKRVEAHFTIERMIKELMTCYEAMLNSRRLGRSFSE